MRVSAVLIPLMAAGWAQAESNSTYRQQLERDQAARRLELKLEQLQFERRARPRPSPGIPGAQPKTAPGGTRLPLRSIPSDTDANAGSAAERRRPRTLFDRERFEQRELQRKQRRRAMTHRAPGRSVAGVADSRRHRRQGQLQRFRIEQQQQLRRFRMRRQLGAEKRPYRR